MKRSCFSKKFLVLHKTRFLKYLKSLFYLCGISVMIYIGYMRDLEKKPNNRLPEEKLNNEDFDGLYSYRDSLYKASIFEISLYKIDVCHTFL